MKIEHRAKWDDEMNDWIIPKVEITGNNMVLHKAKKKEGKETKPGTANPNIHLFENILNLDGESDEEDFETAATKRVNEAINSILVEEDEETQMSYQPPEKQSVFFRYTDEGAVREDPEEAAKKEKNKKKRLESAKRPLTAKKQKVDIANMDVVNTAKLKKGEKGTKSKM
jgi:hypothetical protein